MPLGTRLYILNKRSLYVWTLEQAREKPERFAGVPNQGEANRAWQYASEGPRANRERQYAGPACGAGL